jgi:hypothetical protein
MEYVKSIDRPRPANPARGLFPFPLNLRARALSVHAPSLQLVGIVLLAVLIVAQAARGFTDPDFWWHYKTGEYIVAHHAFPHTDVFGEAPGQQWIAHEWLAEVAIYKLTQAAGYGDALLVLTASPVASIFLLYWIQRREGVVAPLALVLTAIAALMIAPFSTVRPQVLSWLCFAVLIAALLEYRAQRGNWLWALPVLFALWANLHLSFIIGLAILSSFTVAHTAAQWHASRRFDTKAIAAIGACIIATCLNPYGPRLLLVPFRYLPLQSAFTKPMQLAEWQTPDFHNLLFLPLLIALLILIATGLSWRSSDIWPAALVVATATLAFLSVRYIPLFAIAFAATAGTFVVRRFAWACRLNQRPSVVGDWTVRWALILAAAACLALALRPGSASAFQREPSADPGFLPVESMNFIEAHYPHARVFNQYEWGGYILYRLWPANRPFIDGREEMYGLPFLRDYVRVYTVQPGWEDTLRRYDVDLVVVRKDASLAGALESSPNWRLANQDRVSVVYIRAENENMTCRCAG